jgi:taurine dioxygenase
VANEVEFQIARLGAPLGAQVDGIDLSHPVDEDCADALRTALYEHQVLIFPNQDLDADQQLAVAEIFGRAEPPQPARYLGTADPIQIFARTAAHEQTAERWHMDTTYVEDPPIAGVIMPLQIPEIGGDTAWISLYSVYRSLSEKMKTLCEGLEGIHSMNSIRDFMRIQYQLSPTQVVEMDAALPDQRHSLVQAHWATRRKVIFDGGAWMASISGLQPDENIMVRDMLRRKLDDIEFQFRWKWSLGDLAVWDEQSTNHKGLGDHFLVDPNRKMRSVFAFRANHSLPRSIA